jgi:hypothetical protein
VASHLKEKDVIFFKRKPKKESHSSRKAGRDVKFFYKNTTRGTEGGDFYKNPQGLNFTALYADLSLLCFFGFCRQDF